VMQIAEEAARAEQAGVPVEPEVEVEAPQAVSAEAIPPHVSAGARRRFGRRRGALPHCNVCGRVADSTDAAREHWVQAARMSLCPDCQAEGWQLPDGGTVPYRAAHHRRPG
jgi:hypothetical protein